MKTSIYIFLILIALLFCPVLVSAAKETNSKSSSNIKIVNSQKINNKEKQITLKATDPRKIKKDNFEQLVETSNSNSLSKKLGNQKTQKESQKSEHLEQFLADNIGNSKENKSSAPVIKSIAANSKNNENLYWLFSASAQTLAAFIAFLLTGFSLVITLMNSIEEKDETLSDIMHELKLIYYRRILSFSIITGGAIFLSLLSVYVNKFNFSYSYILYSVTVLFDILSLIGGIWVVLSIVNPDRVQKIAYSLYERLVKETEESTEVNVIDFIQKFIELEKIIDSLVESKDVLIEQPFSKRQFLTFRNMVEILLRNEIIDQSLYAKLIELSKIRNYAVHGKIDTINKKYLDLIDEVLNQIKNV